MGFYDKCERVFCFGKFSGIGLGVLWNFRLYSILDFSGRRSALVIEMN